MTSMRPSSTTWINLAVILLVGEPKGSIVEASSRTEVAFESTVTIIGLSQPAIFGNIHGTGNVDFAKLDFEWELEDAADVDDDDDDDATTTALYDSLMVTAVVAKLKAAPTEEEATAYAGNDNKRNEYLAEQGIGALGTDGTYYPCCSEDAIQFSACLNSSLLGHMILDGDKEKKFRLQKREIYASGNTSFLFGFDRVVWVGTGPVMLLFGNCVPATTTATVHIQGTVTFLSLVSGITIAYYLALTAGHTYLCFWYRKLMLTNMDSRIPVETWIYYTLALAAMGISLQTMLFISQLVFDHKILGLLVVSQFVISMAHAVSHCLYLLLAMGVGVTIPAVRSTGIGFLIVSMLVLFLFSASIEDLMNVIGPQDTPFLDLAINLDMILGLVLWIWIPVEIRKTIHYLNFRNETHKAERYEWIWKIYLLASGLTILQYVALIIDTERNASRDFNFMNVEELGNIIYLIILTCMANLWQPNPSQLMYTYQLLDDAGELPGNTNLSLELSEEAFTDEYGDKEEPIQNI